MTVIHRRSAWFVAPGVIAALLAAALVPSAAAADEAPTRLLVTYDEPVDARTVAADISTAATASKARVATMPGRDTSTDRPSP
ncbi:MAG: hypothetical protein ACLFRD_12165, partial [Nitriliruptoraceae bacterium]